MTTIPQGMVIALISALTVGVFILDLVTPPGWAIWLLYILPLLIAFRFNRTGYLIPIAAAATVLIALGLYYSPPGFPTATALFNWTLGTTALWGLTLLLVQRGRTEATLAASEARLRTIIESEPECVKLLDRDGRLLDMNPAGLAMIEADSLDQVRGHRLCALVEESQRPAFKALNEAVFRGESGTLTFETIGLKGGRRWLEIHAVPLRDQGDRISSMLAITRDITERKKAEAEIGRANRALKAIGKCNAALVTCTDESLFMNEFCRILVEDAGYRLAWVGFAGPDDARTVRPVAQAGFESGYLDRARISWADDERGRDPTGTVIRTGRPCVTRNVLTNPAYEPWRAEAMERGYASSAALPLARAGQTIGVLNLYAAEPDAFDEREMALLMELANDLAHGLEFLRVRAERTQAEEALCRSERRLTTLSHRLLEIQEAERRHIARELHDEFGQSLTGLKLGLETALRLRESEVKRALLPLVDQADSLISKSRELSLDLRPAMLDDMGLLPALLFHFERCRERFGLRVRFEHRGVEGRFHPCLETAAFRIVQEALTNVARHARVEEAMVTIMADEDGLNVQVKDEGVGFDPDKIFASGKAVGLSGMCERASLLGGRFVVESVPGAGAQVRVRFPFSELFEREAALQAER